MKKARMLLVVLFTFSLLSTISAQTVDLTFQTEITQEYIAYLDSMEVYYIEQLAAGGDNTQTMKAYMGLSLLQLAKVHISTDTSMADIEPIIVSIEDNLGNVIYLIETDLVPIFSAGSGWHFLLSFFSQSWSQSCFLEGST
jgi:succinyl-CoA synthetase beta subunit